jgi:threonine/homoserine/homoserine lactone efflux protein
VRNTLFGGRGRGLATALGDSSGLLVWTVAASAGVAAIVTASGNPKIVVFFTSLLPQCATGFAALSALGLLFCAVTLAWLVAFAVVVARAHVTLMRPRVRRVVDTLTGITLVAFGARLATEPR